MVGVLLIHLGQPKKIVVGMTLMVHLGLYQLCSHLMGHPGLYTRIWCAEMCFLFLVAMGQPRMSSFFGLYIRIRRTEMCFVFSSSHSYIIIVVLNLLPVRKGEDPIHLFSYAQILGVQYPTNNLHFYQALSSQQVSLLLSSFSVYWKSASTNLIDKCRNNCIIASPQLS